MTKKVNLNDIFHFAFISRDGFKKAKGEKNEYNSFLPPSPESNSIGETPRFKLALLAPQRPTQSLPRGRLHQAVPIGRLEYFWK